MFYLFVICPSSLLHPAFSQSIIIPIDIVTNYEIVCVKLDSYWINCGHLCINTLWKVWTHKFSTPTSKKEKSDLCSIDRTQGIIYNRYYLVLNNLQTCWFAVNKRIHLPYICLPISKAVACRGLVMPCWYSEPTTWLYAPNTCV